MKELLKVVSKRFIIISLIVNTIYSLFDYGQSFVLGYFGTSPLTLDKVIKLTIGMALMDLGLLITGKFGYYIDNIRENKTQREIQKYYFKKLESASADKLNNIHTGYIHKLISNISSLFCNLIWQFQINALPLIIGGGAILYMIFKNSISIGIISIIISTIAVVTKIIMIRKNRESQKKLNESDSKYNATFVDFVQNIITVKKLNIERFCERKIEESGEEYLKDTKVLTKRKANMNTIFTGLINMLNLTVLISTIILVKNGQDGLPYVLFYMSALGKLYYNLNGLVRLFDIRDRFKVTKKQLDEYFKDIVEIEKIEKFKTVSLKEVIFQYVDNSQKILIPEFIMNKGDKISIVGESGQGKSTTMNLLAGIYPIEKGVMKVNNRKVKDKRLDLVFVSQEVELFNLSVRENLKLGQNIPDEKILELIKEAGMEQWYKKLPQGLDTVVGERGIKLSAGQRQRLNLIRGILIDKELYFLDEPTSNLDTVSEERIIHMIEKYLNNKTYIIVTHRPKLQELCNKHYKFENHMMLELI